MEHKVAVVVGSLRAAAWSRKIANELIAVAPSNLKMGFVEIRDLPLYNQDFDDENRPPAQWVTFRQQVNAHDAVLFVTPEYNRSVPAPLKNAIDVGSRPYGQSVWDRKPGAVISVSPSMVGGFGANHHVRQSLVFLNVPCMQMPETYISTVDKKFDASGALTDEKTREVLKRFMTAYAAWVDKTR